MATPLYVCRQSPPARTRPRQAALGFSLVELMVTLAILAILTAVAWPAYQNSVRKGRRSDAMASIAQAMQAQERYRSNHTAYATTLGALNLSASTPGQHYTLAVVSADAVSYVTSATVYSSAQTGDAACGTFLATASAGQVTYSSKTVAGTTNGTPDPCWVK